MSNAYYEMLKRAEESFGTYKVDYTEDVRIKKLFSMIRLQSYYGLMVRRLL